MKTRIDRRVEVGRAAKQDKVTAYQYRTGGICEFFTEPVKHKGLDAIKEDPKARSLGGPIESTECCVWTKGKRRKKCHILFETKNYITKEVRYFIININILFFRFI